MNSLNIVKIGGSVLEEESSLQQFLDDFGRIEGPKILVHGGGTKATALSKELGIPVRMHEGRRITDAESLDVAVMVYAGLINKSLVARLQGQNCNAVGLTGADLNVIPASKRKPDSIDFGFVGDIETQEMNGYFISRLLDEGVVPVFCAITHDGDGQLLNTNADTIASSLCSLLSENYEVRLTYCMDVEGVMLDKYQPDTLFETLNSEQFHHYKQEGVIKDGMIPKLFNGFKALENGVHKVSIKHSKNLLNGTETALIS
ncbi:acetylglutamate kinase [Balneolaceae bacterium YR4-1]|uniref:Acetylglutamate kinase n=1 Tax=Halalkalibaculum roseum TaxID=2709311 RepID=A0A6M1T513_9BACT|nr:acetylglutamate kinase [Halalkalibaculum roseum]NGP77085.1 acetylglutamate kinase [Halalkalibaculum roseum]